MTLNPPSSDGFYTTRTQVEAVAAPAEGFSFGGWFGPSLAGIHGVSGNPARFPVSFAGLNYTGVFTQLPLTTVTANAPGRRIVVDGRTIPVPINFPWDLGSTHTISVEDAVQAGPSGANRWVFQNWSDGGAITHNITVPEDASTFTAEFTEQYVLTTSAVPTAGGDIDAVLGSGDGFYDTGTPVVLTATPQPGFELSTWFGDLTGTENPQALRMSDQQWVGALFLESRELLSGVPVDFSLPAVGGPTIFFGNSGFVVGEHGFGPAPPLDTVDAPILKPSAFGRGWDLGASVHGGAEGRAGDASLLPKRLITMGLRQKNRFNECKECGCAPANNHTCPDLGFQLPIRIAVAGPVAATKGPEALGRAGRSMFRHSRGPIDHLGLFSSRITTALGN